MAASWEFRAYDKEQFSHFIKDYYDVENRVKPLTDDRSVRGYFRGTSSEEFTQAFMSVSTPMHYVADTAAFMVASCMSGGLHMKSEGRAYTVSRNASACLSPGHLLETTTEPGLAVTATHLNTDRVHRICSAWLGSPLDDPLQLDQGRFSSELHEQWALVARSFDLMHSSEHTGDWVFGALEEYAVSLLLHAHPHNYAKYLERKETVSVRMASDAHALIQENAQSPITPAVVAQTLGCSLSALARGFREHMGISLRDCIYAARVARTHRMMTSGTAESYREVLRSAGFMNIARFDAEYRRMFDEAPTDTWRNMTRTRERGGSGRLSPEKAERLRAHILASLAKPIRIEDLAALVGLGTTQFRIVFKKTFGTSPTRYILQERVNWAQWLLSSTDKSIASIAVETGFADQAHFTFVFRRLAGVTPGEVRGRRPLGNRNATPEPAGHGSVET